MTFARVFAIAILAFEMPVPVYWLVLHAPASFWRRHIRPAFFTAVVSAWGIGGALMHHFGAELFHRNLGQMWLIPLGLILLGCDIFTFCKSEASLGGRRIVGHSELAGSHQLIARGLYARVRHPRYAGMILGVIGAALVIGAKMLWMLTIVWLGVVAVMIHMEERELRLRLGPAYAAYADAVPAVIPLPRRSRSNPSRAQLREP